MPSIPLGRRCAIAGRTGSGKTQLAVHLAELSASARYVVINPKHVEQFEELGTVIKGCNLKEINKSIEKNDYTIVNPAIGERAEILDSLVLRLHETWKNVGLLIDELYAMQNAGRPGNGLTAWLTRGRSLGQTFIGCTQRPSWINNFIFSEADYFGVLTLSLKKDREKMYENSGCEEFLINPSLPYYWRWFDVGADETALYAPVKIFSEGT
jgi:energy-coupling factor transporter ATP-binding protein EcfA2